MHVTLFQNEREAQGVRADLSFDELCEMLSEVVIAADKSQRGWSPATFKGDHRKLENVEKVSVLVLDVDVPDLPEMPENLSWFAHKTFSGNWRLAVELDRPYRAEEHARLRKAAMADFKIDETLGPSKAADASRFYFGPTARSLEAFETRRGTGGTLDVDAYLATMPSVATPAVRADAPDTAPPSVSGVLLSDSPIDTEPLREASRKRSIKDTSREALKALADGTFCPKPGERDNTLHMAASAAAMLTDPPQSDEWARALGTMVVQRMGDGVMPEGAEHWLDKWMFSWKRSMKTRTDHVPWLQFRRLPRHEPFPFERPRAGALCPRTVDCWLGQRRRRRYPGRPQNLQRAGLLRHDRHHRHHRTKHAGCARHSRHSGGYAARPDRRRG